MCVSAANKKFSEKTKIILTKSLAAGFGLVSYVVVFLVKYLPGVLEAALGVFGIVGGPVLGGFTLGMFIPWANSLASFFVVFFKFPIDNFQHPFHSKVVSLNEILQDFVN